MSVLTRNIKIQTARLGITEGQLATRCGMTAGAFSIAKTREIPSPQFIQRVAQALGVDEDELTQEHGHGYSANGVLFVKLDDGAIMPTRAHTSDAGLDLYIPTSDDDDELTVYAHDSLVIDTGVHVLIPNGYVGMLKSKSGLNVTYGIVNEGVIDAGYTGSIKVKLYNHSEINCTLKRGDKISQLVIMPVAQMPMALVNELPATDRGANGFGSTGR